MPRFLALTMFLLSTPAFASGSSVFNYLSEKLLCSQAKMVVEKRGAVIFFYGNDLYNRVVKHGGFCMLGEEIRPVQAPTRDRSLCDVGYTCESRSGGDGGSDGQ